MYNGLLERLYARTICDIKTGCWLWTGYKLRRNGYGQLNFSRKLGPVLVHRLAYAIEHNLLLSEIDGIVMHRCNTPACIRPSHLKQGTQRENLEYMSVNGRSARGERSGSAKLTADQVRQIRLLDARGNHTMTELARQFHISIQSIYAIVHRINWRHID